MTVVSRSGSMGRFSNRVAFVTGASSGIGRELSLALAGEGAAVALIGRRADRLADVALTIAKQSEGGRSADSIPIVADVTKREDLDKAVARVLELKGRLDLVVANAGYSVVGLLEELTVDDYRRQFETNVFGVLETIYSTLDALKKSRGQLVIMGSLGGQVPVRARSAYAMSKFALRGLALCIADELAESGVRVTLLSPGYVDTEIRQVDNQGNWQPAPLHRAPARLIAPVTTVAKEMLDAISEEKVEAMITSHARMASLAMRLAPGLMRRIARRINIKKSDDQGAFA